MTSIRDQYEKVWLAKATDEPAGGPIDRWAVTLAEMRPAERLLDLGCGDGRATAAARPPARLVVGAEVSVHACRFALARGVRAVACSGDEPGLPFRGETFDAVTCLDVIEHVLDPLHLMKELERVLEPGGTAYVATVNMRYLKYLWRLAVEGVFPATSDDVEPYDGGHLHYFTAESIRRLGRQAGLRPVRHVGTIPSGRLRLLQPLRRWYAVREFLAAGFVIVFTKPQRGVTTRVGDR